MNRLIWATNYDFAWWKRECRVQFTEGLRYLFALFYVAVFCFIFINFNGLYVRLCVGRNIFLKRSVPRCHHARRFPALRERNGKFLSES